jgi:hypothetical protein
MNRDFIAQSYPPIFLVHDVLRALEHPKDHDTNQST